MTSDQMPMFGVDQSPDRGGDVSAAALLALIAADPGNLPHVKVIAATINDVIRIGQTFSANDIRPYLPSWVKTQVVGPVFGMLRRRKAIELVGYVPSNDPRTHHKPVGRYRLVSPATVEAPHPVRPKASVCPHGLQGGNQPDPWLYGRVSCPECRQVTP
jgi:hypothetical protein